MYITNRLILTPFDESSITPEYIQWLNDSEINEFTSHGIFPITLKEEKEYYQNISKSQNTIVWGIYTKSKSIFIGTIALQSIDLINKSAELSIFIGNKDYWKNGYATEAYKCIIKHGFFKMALNRIYAGTAEYNKGMINVCAKSGMLLERVAREALFINGQFQNCIYYSILRSEWDELQKREER